jgi:hypothetical protein
MFSAITFYWGSDINLHKYVKETLPYTDDIVVGYIDLFGKVPQIDGAKIVPFTHSYLLKYGHSVLLNSLDTECKYDWTFHAAVGKKITNFNKDIIENSPSNIGGYASTEKGLGGAWSNLHNKNRAEWKKTVHEVIVPKNDYLISDQIAIEWERTDYLYGGEVQKRICQMYRQMSRTKWVALEEMNPHPARDRAIEMYKKHEYAYSLNREGLLHYLINNDLEAGM